MHTTLVSSSTVSWCWLQPAMAATTICQIHAIWYCGDVGPGVHFIYWTTTTHFSTAYRMDWWPGCSLSRMQRQVSCRALDGMTTSRRCYTSCTGFQFGSGCISRQELWSTIHWSAWLQLIWVLTVSWHLKKAVISCVLPTRGLASYRQVDLQQLWGPMFCGCWPKAVEQMDISYEQFKLLLDLFVWVFRSQHIVTV